MDPVEFAKRLKGVELWHKQRRVLEMIRDHSRVSVKSGHGVGKTVVAAIAAVWWLVEYNPALVVTTATTGAQVREALWPHIRTFWRDCGAAEWFKHVAIDDHNVNLTELRIHDKRRAYGISTDKPQRIQGRHCPNTLIIVDEASGVGDDMFESLFGLLTSANNKLLLIGNPIIPEGEFYRSHMPGAEYETMSISALESPNVVEGREVIEGLTTLEWVEEQKRKWGKDSPYYLSHVLGEFPDSVEDALVPRPWAEGALERGGGTIPPLDRESLRYGVDVARFGADKTVHLIRDKHAVRLMEAYNGRDLMHTCGQVQLFAKEWRIPAEAIAIDDTGMGGGVTDKLHEDNLAVTPIDFGMRAMDSEHFANMRAELHWNMRNALDPAKGATFAIPPEFDVLCSEMIQSHYTFTSSAQIKIEPKDAIKKRLGRSPDHADALALTFAPLAPSMRIERL